MKQSLLSLMKTGKHVFLTKSMTENSKNACWLLVSVILLTGTLTGIAGPLEDRVRQMAGQAEFMRKEIALYREFTENKTFLEKQVQQQEVLKKLRQQFPEQLEPEEEVQRIYRLAGLHSIKVLRCKRVSAGSVNSDKTGNKTERFLWETEFSGTWYDLIGFLSDIETLGPCTRMETLQICRSAEKEKVSTFSEIVGYTELAVSGRVCVYYCTK